MDRINAIFLSSTKQAKLNRAGSNR